jgi:hypothetical protein
VITSLSVKGFDQPFAVVPRIIEKKREEIRLALARCDTALESIQKTATDESTAQRGEPMMGTPPSPHTQDPGSERPNWDEISGFDGFLECCGFPFP